MRPSCCRMSGWRSMIAVSVSSRCRHAGSRPVCSSAVPHDRRQVAGLELARREVDGDASTGRSGRPSALPAARLPAGHLEHLRAERHDETAVLGDGDEGGGRQDRAVVRGDPGERLEADDARRSTGRRRVGSRRRSGGRRAPTAASAARSIAAGPDGRGRRRRPRRVPPPSDLAWYMAVSASWRRVSAVPRPPTETEMPTLAATRSPSSTRVGPAAQLGDEPGADVDRVQVAVDVGREHDELVAADAGDGVHRSQDGDQLVGDPSQHGVARGVALRVVDLLEPVEVDEEHGGAPTGALRVRQRLVDAVDEERPVRQAGQRVVGRLLGERGLRVLQVGHPLGLRLAEPGDLAVLRLLRAEVGEREAGETVAVDVERRDARRGPERPSPSPFTRSTSTVAPRPPGPRISSSPIGSAAGDEHRERRPHDRLSAGTASSSASRRLAYRMSPLDDSVAAPSRMFSTNIRYGRSAVDSVNTRRPGPPSETTKASTSPARDRAQRVLGLGHARPAHRIASATVAAVRRVGLDDVGSAVSAPSGATRRRRLRAQRRRAVGHGRQLASVGRRRRREGPSARSTLSVCDRSPTSLRTGSGQAPDEGGRRRAPGC